MRGIGRHHRRHLLCTEWSALYQNERLEGFERMDEGLYGITANAVRCYMQS